MFAPVISKLLSHPEDVKKENPTCDEALGMYLVEMAQRVTLQGYTQLTYFLSSLRECVNLRSDIIPGEKVDTSRPFTEANPPQHLAEAANLFVCEYIVGSDLCREDAVAMMLHLSQWLHCRKLSTLQLCLCDK